MKRNFIAFTLIVLLSLEFIFGLTLDDIIKEPNEIISKEIKSFQDLEKDQSYDFLISKSAIDVKKITIFPEVNLDSITLEIELLKNEPIPLNITNLKKYQYYLFSHSTTKIDYEILFRINKSWINKNQIKEIILLQYEDGWKENKAKKIAEDSMYEIYKLKLENEGYFVIGGSLNEKIISVIIGA